MGFKKFAAFIMTYERPEIVVKSIEILRAQFVAPEYILIIDNSKSRDTAILIEQRYSDNPRIEYYRVGYNSGPAGASKIGLNKLTKLGYRWIYWGDDNNPPRDSHVFEQIFQRIEDLENKSVKIGVIGGKGALLNEWTGNVTALRNSDLKDKNVVEVDYVAGGQTMIVNSSVVKLGVLPVEKLFFSFEDLDFCLKVKKMGFKIFVDSKTWYKVRKSYNDVENNYRFSGNSFGNKNLILRNYYSTRSLLYILFANKLYVAFLFQIVKSILKIIIGFKYGLTYGLKNGKFQSLAMFDFFRNNYKFNLAPHTQELSN